MRWSWLLAALAACTHPPATNGPGSGAVDGTFNGMTLTVASALTGCGLLGGNQTRRVVLFNVPDACTAIATSWPDDEQWLAIDLFDVANDGTWSTPAATGSPTIIYDDPTGAGSYAALSIEASSNTYLFAQSGTIDISAVSASGTTGTFDVELEGNVHVSGWFDAPHCSTVSTGPVPNGDLFKCQ